MCTTYLDQGVCSTACTSVEYYVVDGGELVCKKNSTYAFPTGMLVPVCPPTFAVQETAAMNVCVSECPTLYRHVATRKSLVCVDACDEYIVRQGDRLICV